MADRPNILYLMSDQHRADVLGYAGNRIVRTPTLDKLAETGIAFQNAYCPSPICVPARQSLMAGQLPRTCGCDVQGQDLQPGHMTFARRLAQYGYQTVLCGQNFHFGVDIMQGWTKLLGLANAELTEGRVEEEYAKYAKPLNRTEAEHIQRAGIGRGYQVIRDEYTLQGALNIINEYFNSPYDDRITDRPLLLKVVFAQPHYPFTAEENKFNYYLNRVEPFLAEHVSDHPVLGKNLILPGVDVSERDIRRATAAYYAMVETMDGYCCSILEALEQAGQNLDDWIIIYSGDHGEMLGEHGGWWKGKFYEASVKVPLIIRWPKRFSGGKVCSENVNLYDLFSTMCELANIPTPDGLDSRSLVPLMEGTGPWDNETISQYFFDQVMIKRNHLKYQNYGPDYLEVLFDLENDPMETINLIDEHRYAAELDYFRTRCIELGYGPMKLRENPNR